MTEKAGYVRWFRDLSSADVADVGGKNASLGEMIDSLKDKGVEVPDGFATTASAYSAFLDKKGGLREKITSQPLE
jgi:pyruvate,water dikinase